MKPKTRLILLFATATLSLCGPQTFAQDTKLFYRGDLDGQKVEAPNGAIVNEEAYGFEAFYNIALSQGVALTLDAQVIDPVVDGVDTATILGARLNIRF